MNRVQPIVRKLIQHSYCVQDNDCKRRDSRESYSRICEPAAVAQTISPQPNLHCVENEGYVYC